MEILDPDLWNDDGTAKRPSQEYMDRLEEAGTPFADLAVNEAYVSHARRQRQVRMETPPGVGDIVHLWLPEGNHRQTCQAAIVTAMDPEDWHLIEVTALAPGVLVLQCYAQVPHDESKTVASWHWAESQ